MNRDEIKAAEFRLKNDIAHLIGVFESTTGTKVRELTSERMAQGGQRVRVFWESKANV